uniref:Putative secreted protein n=1 Tax=Ixodes ricinus TaxID=34613 RepID=A0A6B0U3W5_IXORI
MSCDVPPSFKRWMSTMCLRFFNFAQSFCFLWFVEKEKYGDGPQIRCRSELKTETVVKYNGNVARLPYFASKNVVGASYLFVADPQSILASGMIPT